MKSKKPKRLSPLETVIMDAVWSMGEATARQVQERLQSEKPMAYNTVLTMMRILRDKEFLTSRREGRLDIYVPAVTREQMARRSLLDVLDNFFVGSARALVSQLLDSGDLSQDEIKAIRTEVDRKLHAKAQTKGEKS